MILITKLLKLSNSPWTKFFNLLVSYSSMYEPLKCIVKSSHNSLKFLCFHSLISGTIPVHVLLELKKKHGTFENHSNLESRSSHLTSPHDDSGQFFLNTLRLEPHTWVAKLPPSLQVPRGDSSSSKNLSTTF